MKNYSRFLVPSFGIVFVLVMFMLIQVGNNVIAQSTKSENIKTQLLKLNKEMEAGNIMIGFQFVAPISEGNNYWLFGDNNDKHRLAITEISEDHFCFSETSNQSVLIRCIPYTNIAEISYLGT